MSKSIKISEENYQRMCDIQRPRETYNDIIGRLLDIMDWARKVSKQLSTRADPGATNEKRTDK